MSYAWFHLKFIEPLDLSPSSLLWLRLLLLSLPQLLPLAAVLYVSIFFNWLCLRSQYNTCINTSNHTLLNATHSYTCSARNADARSFIHSLSVFSFQSNRETKHINLFEYEKWINKTKQNQQRGRTNHTLLIRNRIAFENYWFFLLFLCLVCSLVKRIIPWNGNLWCEINNKVHLNCCNTLTTHTYHVNDWIWLMADEWENWMEKSWSGRNKSDKNSKWRRPHRHQQPSMTTHNGISYNAC